LSPDDVAPPTNILGFVEQFSRGARYRVLYARYGVWVFVRA
jgi:hypothetical protein